jgi:hypothetical protein
MKMHKYVRLGFSGDSLEVKGDILHMSSQRTNGALPDDLNRLLAEGWRPVRETVVDWHYWRLFRKIHYPYVFILMEKDAEEETRITDQAPAY